MEQLSRDSTKLFLFLLMLCVKFESRSSGLKAVLGNFAVTAAV